MKKVILALFAVLILVIPAYAVSENGEPGTIANTYQVRNFAELQDALDKVDDGDTIELQNPITISESITIGSVDKHITITLKSQYYDRSSVIFSISNFDDSIEVELRNITFDFHNIQSGPILCVFASELLIDDCVFRNIQTNSDYVFMTNNFLDKQTVTISNSTFDNISVNGCLFNFSYDCNTIICDCSFENLRLSYRGLIYNEGIITLSKNNYQKNTVDDYWSTVDSRGTVYLDTDTSHYTEYYGYEPQGWYKIIEKDWMTDDDSEPHKTEKIEVDTINESCRLVFFTEQAADDSVSEQPQDDNDDPNHPGEENSEDTQPPQEPGDQAGDNDATDENHPSQEPTQPPEGEKTDDPTDNPDSGDNDSSQEPVQPPEDGGEDDTTDTPSQEPELPQDDNTDDALDEGQDTPQPPQSDSENESDENPEQSVEPPQAQTQPKDGESEDNPADSTETPVEPPQGPSDQDMDNTPDNPDNTPDTPQKPSDSDNGEDGNYTPPADYRPSYRPTQPSTSNKQSAETDLPQEKLDNAPAPMEPQLACNGAVIDTSRTVVLLGYGDGLLHEDDPLTRGQLAAIVYRLLDDESITLYSNAPSTFVDVAADAWYAPYVRIIQAAGIVNGVGDGKYNPDGTVTWAHIITILTRFVEPQEYTLQHIQYDGWATQAIQTAVALDWIRDRAYFDPDAIISRGELVQLINSVLALYR